MLALSPLAAAATTDWPRCAEPLRRAHGKQVGWPLSIIVAAQARCRASSDRAAPGKGLKAPHVSQPRPPWHTPQCTPFPKQQSLVSRPMALNHIMRLFAGLPLALHRPSANLNFLITSFCSHSQVSQGSAVFRKSVQSQESDNVEQLRNCCVGGRMKPCTPAACSISGRRRVIMQATQAPAPQQGCQTQPQQPADDGSAGRHTSLPACALWMLRTHARSRPLS